MKKAFVGLAAATALVVTGCGLGTQEDDNYVGVCVDRSTNQRVDDSRCPSGAGYNSGMDFFWGYFLASSLMPRVGAPVSGYQTTVDTRRYNAYRGGVAKNGGYVKFDSYKPKSSTITQKDKSLSSSKWKTYDQTGKSKSGWSSGNSGSKSKSGGFGGGSKSSGFGGGSRSSGGRR